MDLVNSAADKITIFDNPYMPDPAMLSKELRKIQAERASRGFMVAPETASTKPTYGAKGRARIQEQNLICHLRRRLEKSSMRQNGVCSLWGYRRQMFPIASLTE